MTVIHTSHDSGDSSWWVEMHLIGKHTKVSGVFKGNTIDEANEGCLELIGDTRYTRPDPSREEQNYTLLLTPKDVELLEKIGVAEPELT